MDVSPIIAPVPIELLKSELTEDKRLRFTNKSDNEIYIVTWQCGSQKRSAKFNKQ